MRPLKLGIVAGEPSGDRLGAGLVSALQRSHADTPVELYGVGGDLLADCGLNSLVALAELSMHGFAEPLQRLPFLWSLLRRIEEQMLDERVDVFVGVDFNVFNLLLEGRLKRRGIPVVHYVSPSVYAWRRGRTHRVARSCDVLLTLFPFEPPLYVDTPVRAVFVGHPLADEIEPATNPIDDQTRRAHARQLFDLPPGDSPVVTLMPGSRTSEVRQMLRPFLHTALLVLEQQPGARFLLPCASAEIETQVREALSKREFAALPMIPVDGQAREALRASCLLYTSPSPRDRTRSRMPSSA